MISDLLLYERNEMINENCRDTKKMPRKAQFITKDNNYIVKVK